MNMRGVNFPAKGTRGGHLSAIVPMTGKRKWQMAWPGQPSTAGTLSTGGGLVFTAAATGEFMLDAAITQALADGNLARWAAAEGVSWTPPSLPEVSRGPSMADLAAR